MIRVKKLQDLECIMCMLQFVHLSQWSSTFFAESPLT